MRTLIVTLGIPHPSRAGRQIRDYHVVRELAREAKVFVLSVLMEPDDTDTAPIREIAEHRSIPVARTPLGTLAALMRRGMPIATRTFYARSVADAIREIVVKERIDIVQLEHSFLACYHAAIPSGCRSVLSFHNVGAQQYRRMAAIASMTQRASMMLKARLMSEWEPELARRFDAVVTVSHYDGELLAAGGVPAHVVTVVENGVDTDRLQPLPAPRGNTLIFAGVMGYPPNEDAVLRFCESSLPRIRDRIPGVRLSIVGQAPSRAVRALDGRDGIRVTGEVPEMHPYYREAAVAIVPLRAGGGTRIKILEALALGRSVVSTSVGCEGLSMTNERELLVADSPTEFTDAVVRLLEDHALGRTLAENGRRLAETRYDWRTTVAPLRALHRRLAFSSRA